MTGPTVLAFVLVTLFNVICGGMMSKTALAIIDVLMASLVLWIFLWK